MKILLLTDIPPCHNFTAGLVLDRLVKFLPLDQLSICTIVNPNIKPVIPSDLEKKVPILWLKKPRESVRRFFLRGKIANLAAFTFELFQGARVRYLLLPQIINFAKQQQVDALWVVLQGQTIVRLARPLANRLKLPLYTQVYDPFEWWLRANRLDHYAQRRLLKEFDEVIKMSTSCATASLAMSKLYTTKYGIPNIPVISSLPQKWAMAAAAQPNHEDTFTIAMAGQFYAKGEWDLLIRALDQVNWVIAGKRIKLRVFGGSFQMATAKPANFEYLGWCSQENLVNLLSKVDLLYMPYWFSEEYRLEATNSFPSKLVTYFAAGRPVFCHAPYYASPTRYIAKYNAGFICISEDIEVILKALEEALTDHISYAVVAKNGTECFHRDFTLDRMKESFFEFLGIEKSDIDSANITLN